MKIIALIGKIGTGKTTISKELSVELDYDFLEVSSVVKSILNMKKRPRGNKLTGRQVGKEVLERVEGNCVISGIRQKEILDMLKEKHEVVTVQLILSEWERFKRISKKRHMDIETFKKESLLDKTLGLSELERDTKFSIEFLTKGTIEESIKELKRRLKKCP